MAKRILGVRCEPHLVTSSAWISGATSTSGVSAASRSVSKRDADDRRGIQRLFRRRPRRSMRAPMVGLQRGRYIDIRNVAARSVAPGCPAVHPVQPDRAPSPRQKTGFRQPGRPDFAANSPVDGPAPSSSAVNVDAVRIAQRSQRNCLSIRGLGQRTVVFRDGR